MIVYEKIQIRAKEEPIKTVRWAYVRSALKTLIVLSKQGCATNVRKGLTLQKITLDAVKIKNSRWFRNFTGALRATGH